MPELPEVEAVRQALRPFVCGRKIRRVDVLHAIATKPQKGAELARFAEKRTICAVSRHGKYLILELDRGILVVHFRLDGQLLWLRSAQELQRKANRAPHNLHVDIAFELDRGVLGFADRRHFGRIHYFQSHEASGSLNSLGVDALSKDFTAAHFTRLLKASRRPLKEFLLDQSHVAGIGNIYASESMWHAKIDPRRRANSLSKSEAAKLHKAIVSVLRRALECCLHPAPDFRNPAWWFEGLEKILRAYGLENKPCRTCGSVIRRIEQGGRGTYFCKHCQT